MRILFVLALAASLSACSLARPESAGAVIVQADITIEKVETIYQHAKLVADVLEPFLPPARVAQIHRVEAKIEMALALAREAVSAADRLKHLYDALKAIGDLDSAAPPG